MGSDESGSGGSHAVSGQRGLLSKSIYEAPHLPQIPHRCILVLPTSPAQSPAGIKCTLSELIKSWEGLREVGKDLLEKVKACSVRNG